MQNDSNIRKIDIQTKESYGKANKYVVGTHAAAIQQLTGKKTVDHSDIAALISLGFEVIDIGRPESQFILSPGIKV